MTLSRRFLSCAAGLALDRAFGEPPARWHPVALFGRSLTHVEGVLWRDRHAAGVVYAATGVVIGAVSGRILRSTTLAVALAAAGRELRHVASLVEDACLMDDLGAARRELPSLVGRDPARLNVSGVSAAVIESLAENSVDAVVAPVFWGLAFGAPGALGYRAINTMDAMVGHTSDRYRNFGWASARLDDGANYIPARLFACAVQAAMPTRRGHIRHAIASTAAAHPSPNAGVAEAAVAGALGCELGGPLRYGDVVEERPRLGSGPRPQPADITAARALVTRVENLLIAALTVAGLADVITSLLRSWRAN